MDIWMDGWVDGWIYGHMDVWKDGQIDEWMDRQVGMFVDGRMDQIATHTYLINIVYYTEICIHTHMLSFMWSEKYIARIITIKNNMIVCLLKINNNIFIYFHTCLYTGIIHVVIMYVCMYVWMDGWMAGWIKLQHSEHTHI